MDGPFGDPHIGRIEVMHNSTWGTICDDSWSRGDATVACRSVFSMAHIHIQQAGRGSYRILRLGGGGIRKFGVGAKGWSACSPEKMRCSEIDFEAFWRHL